MENTNKLIDLKIHMNKNNKQKTITLPKKVFGLVAEAKFDVKKRSIVLK